MGMDVDYLAAMQAIDELKKIVCDTEHGKRSEIADGIIEFVRRVKEEYGESTEPAIFKPAAMLGLSDEEVLDAEKERLTVTISGAVNSGKSSLLYLLKEGIKESGFEVEFDGGLDFKDEKQFDVKMADKVSKNSDYLKECRVIVFRETQLQKTPSAKGQLITVEDFDFNSWGHMHDCIETVSGVDSQLEQLVDVFNSLPVGLKNEALEWGMNDTLWRDKFIEWYKEKLESQPVE